MRFISRFRKLLDDMKSEKFSRELLAVDKYGNKYYQYYSNYGLPMRREVCQWKLINLDYSCTEGKSNGILGR